MTVYVAELMSAQNGNAAFDKFALAPATLPIKIISVQYTGTSQQVHLFRTVGSISGGTAVATTPTRYGSPSSTTTVKFGVTITGTPSYFGYAGNEPSPFQPKVSVIIGPGNVFAVQSLSANTLTSVIVYYDELEIQPGY